MKVDCFLKRNMNYSENTIILKSNKILVRHVAEPLAEKNYWEKKKSTIKNLIPWERHQIALRVSGNVQTLHNAQSDVFRTISPLCNGQ